MYTKYKVLCRFKGGGNIVTEPRNGFMKNAECDGGVE
jgi:hypothetical protein